MLKSILLILNEKSGQEVEDIISYRQYFTDVVSASENIAHEGVAFISLDERHIEYIALFKKTGRVATKKDRVKFYNLIRLEKSVSIQEIRHLLPKNMRRYYAENPQPGVNALSPKLYECVLQVIKSLNPENTDEIASLEAMRLNRHRYPLFDDEKDIVACEKDAVNLAFRVAGFSEDDIPEWRPGEGTAPFLKGLKSVPLREDAMIARDAEVFGDWGLIEKYLVGASTFEKDGHNLSIMNVNRHPIEETLGVDLILYHHTYTSYVMVQYKRMMKEKSGEYVYRPNDKSYLLERKRMESYIKQSKAKVRKKIDSPIHYRLNSELFYFKCCPAKNADLFKKEMIKGMYLPLSYWKVLLKSSNTTGPKKGKSISYKNVGRYLNNTKFVELFQGGWIGSVVEDSAILSAILRDSIENNKSVVLANYFYKKPEF